MNQISHKANMKSYFYGLKWINVNTLLVYEEYISIPKFLVFKQEDSYQQKATKSENILLYHISLQLYLLIFG
jgi:hypothetical protein